MPLVPEMLNIFITIFGYDTVIILWYQLYVWYLDILMLKYMILHDVLLYFKYLAFTMAEMGQILRWGSASISATNESPWARHRQGSHARPQPWSQFSKHEMGRGMAFPYHPNKNRPWPCHSGVGRLHFQYLLQENYIWHIHIYIYVCVYLNIYIYIYIYVYI